VFSSEHLHKMKEGISLFNEQKYWECHEALEDVWMEDAQDPVRNVYWAVIQVAASCIHYREQNLVGAQGMITKAKEKFRRCRDQKLLSSLAFDYLDWQEFEEIVMKVPDGKNSKLEDFIDIFNFRFKNYPADGIK